MSEVWPKRMEQWSIPDEEVHEWIETLHNGGMNTQEINLLLGKLNEEFFCRNLDDILEAHVDRVLDHYEQEREVSIPPVIRRAVREYTKKLWRIQNP